jgi:hypothetical protein
MAERPNGLASLTQARQRARRTMPPPRHPAAPRHLTSAETQPNDQPHDPGTEEQLPVPATPLARVARAPEQVEQVASEDVSATSGTVEPPVKMTFYVDQAMDRYLEDVRIRGLTSRPKVDVSRSAVVRLALRRLREEMNPEQVKTLLAAQPTDPTKTGRKRR